MADGDVPQAGVAGQWKEAELTLPQLRAALEQARAGLPDVPEPVRETFCRAVEGFQVRLEYEARRLTGRGRSEDEPFPWRGLCSTLDESVLPAPEIQRLMLLALEGGISGAEIRGHHGPIVITVAIHVSAGTLELRYWPGINRMHASYAPVRTAELLESYRDGCARVALPYAIWKHAGCWMKLAEARDGIGDVPTFTHGGREYTVMGITHGPQWVEADAWAIVPLALWRGATSNRSQMLAAWNAGDTERGDCRGRLVRVRGQMCVLEALRVVYDEAAGWMADADAEVSGEEEDGAWREEDAMAEEEMQ